jgi:DNA-binding protein H-NS
MMDTNVKKGKAKPQSAAPKQKEAKPVAAAEINLGQFSTQELRDLARNVEAEIRARRAEDRKNALRGIKDLVASYGFTVDEVLGTGPRTRRRASVPAQGRYRNPENPNQTWVGRGRKPGWLVELLAQGKTLEELEVS